MPLQNQMRRAAVGQVLAHRHAGLARTNDKNFDFLNGHSPHPFPKAPRSLSANAMSERISTLKHIKRELVAKPLRTEHNARHRRGEDRVDTLQNAPGSFFLLVPDRPQQLDDFARPDFRDWTLADVWQHIGPHRRGSLIYVLAIRQLRLLYEPELPPAGLECYRRGLGRKH